MRESTQALWSGFIIAMLLIFAFLAVALNNYIQPLIVMLAIPFGIVGAVIGHILLGYDLSLVSLMGVIALSGVVVNDSLIMIDYANKHRGDLSAYDAIHEAGHQEVPAHYLNYAHNLWRTDPHHSGNLQSGLSTYSHGHFPRIRHYVRYCIILVIVPCLYMILDDIAKATKEKVRELKAFI